MYRRFLNNSDYLGIITKEALLQLTRGNDDRFTQAEQSAEMSIVEYLSENYEVEKELAKGKYIADYDRRITYPVGVHIYFDGQIAGYILSEDPTYIPDYKGARGMIRHLNRDDLLRVFIEYYFENHSK